MTCIVGVIGEDGTVHLGGDSASVDSGFALTVRADPKVFRVRDDMALGFTTSFRMGQILRYGFAPPPLAGGDVFRYMVGPFVNAVRAAFKDGGFASRGDGPESGGTFLVGFYGRLFMVQDDYQVEEVRQPFAACGCGAAVALGSLYSTIGQDPEHRILEALRAAETFSAGVRAPFVTVRAGRGAA